MIHIIMSYHHKLYVHRLDNRYGGRRFFFCGQHVWHLMALFSVEMRECVFKAASQLNENAWFAYRQLNIFFITHHILGEYA